MTISQMAVKTVVRVKFENPNLHSTFTNDKSEVRMPCPNISPDPTAPITS